MFIEKFFLLLKNLFLIPYYILKLDTFKKRVLNEHVLSRVKH